MHNFPTLAGLNPSTSFIYVIVLNASFISKCIGIGLCNKIPFIVLSSFSFFISSINSSCSIFSSNKYSTYSTPTSAHALLLFRTYTFEAGLLPTNHVFNWQPEDYMISDIFSQYYVNFVKTGNPNGLGLPEWPSTNGKAVAPVLQIDVNTKVKSDAQMEKRYDFIDKLFWGEK